MIAWNPQGPIQSFTADTSPPTSVQVPSLAGMKAPQVMLTNISSTQDCVVGWGQTDAEAKFNAITGTNTPNQYYLLRGTQVAVSAGPNDFFTGIAAGSDVIKVQPGYGN